ncbi:M20/M25/M40 family metallo-hydrolase [Temperatibacter marinus]|uniref:M20/M25/M40 family metallo-hydrolase n=1 Tax=Temperatibacter marinus TaxID=1456591 RepID=A0AA52EDS1_9PROT|nr:M20/M25/M40 family metallo-hydrolase [Temperatibacter marinus]WND02926.1 M20/M25/M40 family metallo-hydrolase [Temperatibacter marinus]
MVKNALKITGLLLGIVITLTLYNFFTIDTPKVSSKAPALSLDASLAHEVLARAIRFPTVSYNDRTKMDRKTFASYLAFLYTEFPTVFSELDVDIVAEMSLLLTWKGSNVSLKPAMFIAHHDVVPINPETEEEWKYPPFSGTIADGYIWGRGAIDDKGNMIALLYALEELVKTGFEPERSLYFGFGHDEEIGGKKGAGSIAALLKKRGKKMAFILDEGGAVADPDLLKELGVKVPTAMVAIAEKGYLDVLVEARGPAGHSSKPKPDTSLVKLSRALLKLEDNQPPLDNRYVIGTIEPLLPYMTKGNQYLLSNIWLFGPLVNQQLAQSAEMAASMHRTVVPTIARAGIKSNVIPPLARATVNLRLFPGETPEQVLKDLVTIIDDPDVSISILRGHVASPIKPASGKEWDLLYQSIKEMDPALPITSFLDFGGTDLKNYYDVSDRQFRFAFHPLNRDILDGMHGVNEKMPVKSYAKNVEFFYRILSNAAEANWLSEIE